MSFAARTDKSEMRAVEKDFIHGWSMARSMLVRGQVHLLDRPIRTSFAGHSEGSCRLCFLRIMAAIVPRRAAPDGLSESPLLI